MSIQYHPKCGTILICDFIGFREPEAIKVRPVIVISHQWKDRPALCTVVALSTREPEIIKPYHYKLHFSPLLPPPYNFADSWVKGDLIYSVSFARLDFPKKNKVSQYGRREYDIRVLSPEELRIVQNCVLASLGLPEIKTLVDK